MDNENVKDNLTKEEILSMIKEIKALKSPFGNYGEWYDGQNDVLQIVLKYCIKQKDNGE